MDTIERGYFHTDETGTRFNLTAVPTINGGIRLIVENTKYHGEMHHLVLQPDTARALTEWVTAELAANKDKEN